MKIPTKEPILGLDGQPLKMEGKDFTLGEAIANILLVPSQQPVFKATKALILATKFYSDKEVELDESDAADLFRTIERANGAIMPLVLGRVSEMLEKYVT